MFLTNMLLYIIFFNIHCLYDHVTYVEMNHVSIYYDLFSLPVQLLVSLELITVLFLVCLFYTFT